MAAPTFERITFRLGECPLKIEVNYVVRMGENTMGSYLIVLALGAGYGGGVWKFWQAYPKTNFKNSILNRISLSLLWPVLLLLNSSYRSNFRRALKGRR